MLAGDNITLTAINRRFRQAYRIINSVPADKITLTTRQFRIIVGPDTAEALSTSINQTLPFFPVYVLELFEGRE